MTDFKFPGSNFVSGDWQNGFGLSFSPDDDGLFTANYTFAEHQQGPPGIAHGGAIASLLDEAMTAAAVHASKRIVVTVTMNLRYHAPTVLGQPMTITGQITHRSGRKIQTEATLTSHDGTLLASAEALFIALEERPS